MYWAFFSAASQSRLPAPYAGRRRHYGPAEVQGFQQRAEVAGLVVFSIDLEMIHDVPAVLGDAEQMDPGAVGVVSPA